MSGWLDPVGRALDESAAPADFFFRDDDAGWSDDRLRKLLDCFEQYAAPIDLAVIPEALTSELAAELRARIDAAPERIAIHQHGFAHLNHELAGRKCEFGSARSTEQQYADIRFGKLKLATLLGPVVSPIFTPPWNRCSESTGDCLVQLGFSVLSRDLTAPPLGIPGLRELPISIDWFGKKKGARLSRERIGNELAGTVRQAGAIGVMLHHQLMDADERLALGGLLALIKSHQQARSFLMDEIAARLAADVFAPEACSF